MSGRKALQNSQEGSDGDRIDHEGLGWALTKIREWRGRVENRTRIDDQLLAKQIVRLAQSGVQESLLGFVILGCEWMFRLRTSGPRDAEVVLSQIESRLLPVLHEHAWLVTEALAPRVRKLLKTQRVLAPEWEDVPSKVFVVTDPRSVDEDFPSADNAGYVSPVRTRPDPLIRARRGPAPKLAPWIVGVIAERLIHTQKGDGHRPTSGEQEPVMQLVSALVGRRAIDRQEYVVRRRNLQVQELDDLVGRFKSLHDQLATWNAQESSGNDPDWFRVVRARLKEFGPRDTFPYDLQIVTRLVEAYGTSPTVNRTSSDRASVPKSSRSRRRRSD
jgi:hypothetical protein